MDILILILATWRISSLLTYEPGPYKVFERLRAAAQGELAVGLDCLWCNSIWVGVILTAVYITLPVWVLLPLAVSTGAILLEELTGKLDNGTS